MRLRKSDSEHYWMYKAMFENVSRKWMSFKEAYAMASELGKAEDLQALWELNGNCAMSAVLDQAQAGFSCGHCLSPLVRDITAFREHIIDYPDLKMSGRMTWQSACIRVLQCGQCRLLFFKKTSYDNHTNDY